MNRPAACVALALHLVFSAPGCAAAPGVEEKGGEENATVTWVHDGDTVWVRIGAKKERVRLIGIDTDELDAAAPWRRTMAYRARDYAIGRLKNRRVVLRGDPLCTDRDDYGRLLRYLILPDGVNFNGEMIRQGYARAFTRFRFTLSREFVSAEREARSARLGRWARGPEGSD